MIEYYLEYRKRMEIELLPEIYYSLNKIQIKPVENIDSIALTFSYQRSLVLSLIHYKHVDFIVLSYFYSIVFK